MDKKLILIACSEGKKGSYSEKDKKKFYGYIERVSPSEKLGKLESYGELTKKREEILFEYNKKEFFKNINKEERAIAIYNGKQYKNKDLTLKNLISEKSSEYDMIIVSTLYGIVHFSDKIYPYEVGDMTVYWNSDTSCELLRKIILEYYKEKKFHSMHVFLSQTYFNALKLEHWGDDNSIFCYILLKNGKRASWYPISNTLFSFLKNGYIKEDFNLKICNPSQYRNY